MQKPPGLHASKVATSAPQVNLSKARSEKQSKHHRRPLNVDIYDTLATPRLRASTSSELASETEEHRRTDMCKWAHS